MKRWTLPRVPLFSLLSLLLLIATIVFWVRSRNRADVLIVFNPSGHYTGLATERLGVAACLTNVPAGEELALTTQSGILPRDEYEAKLHDVLFDKTNIRLHLLGFWTAAGTFSPNPWKFNAAIIPYWALILIFAILPFRVFPRIYTRWQRKRRGQCLYCGYDLRHSPSRCPECGKPAPGSQIAEVDEPSKSGRGIRIVPALLLGIALAAGFNLHHRNAQAAAHPLDPATLDRPIADLNIDRATLPASLAQLQATSGLRIRIGKIQSTDIDSNLPLHLHLRDVKSTVALHALVSQAGRNSIGDCDIWETRKGELVLTDMTDSPRTVRIYPIGDLLDEISPGFAASAKGPTTYTFGQSAPLSMHDLALAERSLAGDAVVNLLENTVNVDGWRDNGGSISDLYLVSDRLVIVQTQDGHARVRHILNSLRCDGTSEGTPVDPEATASHADIDQPIKTLDLQPATLESAIETLRKTTQANIVVFWDDLAAAGIDRNKPIKVQLADITLRQALDVLMALAGPQTAGYDLHENIIRIGTKENLIKDGGLSTRLYDVRDILDQFIAYHRSHPPQTQPANANTTHGGITNQLFVSNQPSSESEEQDAVETLSKLIEDMVATDSWRDNGGAEGNIREFAGRLVITQTPENHQKVVQLLRTLRAGGSKEGGDLFKN